MTTDAFDELASLYLDGGIEPEGMAELNRALATRPDLATRFVHLGRVHGSLRELSVAEPIAAPARSRVFTLVPLGVAAAMFLALILYVVLPFGGADESAGRPGAPGAVLFVGQIKPLSPGDRAIRDRLARLGFRVTPVKDTEADLTWARGQALLVLSESTVSSEIGTRLTEAPVPILNCEPNLNATLRMAVRAARPDEIFLKGKQKTIRIIAPSHPLAAGLNGVQLVYEGRDGFVSWGVPDETVARVIARTDTKESEPVIFGYEAGKGVRGAVLPARRLSFFLASNTNEAERLTPEGWKLFDAAVAWLTESH